MTPCHITNNLQILISSSSSSSCHRLGHYRRYHNVMERYSFSYSSSVTADEDMRTRRGKNSNESYHISPRTTDAADTLTQQPRDFNASTHSFTIHFSRNFQRFVVSQHNNDNDIHKTKLVSVGSMNHTFPMDAMTRNSTFIESFSFLDEARTKYPTAYLIPCQDMIDPQGTDHYECILAGMGRTPSRIMLLSSSSSLSSPSSVSSYDPPINDNNNNLIVMGAKGQRLSRSIPGFQALEYLAYITVACTGGNHHTKKTLLRTMILPPPLASHIRMDYTILQSLGEKISQNRFAAFTPMDIYHNFQTIMDLFTSSCHFHHRGENSHRKQEEEKEDMHTLKTNSSSSSSSSSFFVLEKGIGLAMTEKEAFHVISSFPHLCLYNPYDIQERIRFMISSFPDFEQEIFQDPRRKYIPTMELDPYTIPWKGYGAGLTVQQATSAIQAIPQLLAMFHEDAKKPSMLYFYQYLKVPLDGINEVQGTLFNYLSGSDPSDVCTFAYLLRTLNIRMDQMKLLLEAMPTLTFCMIDDTFRFDHAGISNQVNKESKLHFLRKRLQLTNGDVKAMIKVL